jgi:hypothetical protein
MKTEIIMLKLIYRWLLAMQIYAMEILIAGQTECIASVGDPIYCARIEIARHVARAELARLRSAYNATLPVGKRVTWSMA